MARPSHRQSRSGVRDRSGVRPQAPPQVGVETLICLSGTYESFAITNINVVIAFGKYDRKSKMAELTAPQIRAARALLDWTQPELAKKSKLSVPTIRRMEGERGPSASTAANVEAVRRTLEEAGVVFLDSKEMKAGGVGVRLKK